MTDRIAGSTGNTEYFRLVTNSGTPLLGALVASMMLAYTRNRSAPVASLCTAMSSEGAAHLAYRGFEIYSGFSIGSNFAPGEYRIDVPDAAYATGVDKMALALTHPLADPAIHYFTLTGSIQASVDSISARIASIAAQVNSNFVALGSNTSAIGSNGVAIGSLHTRIGSLDTRVASIGVNVASNAVAISSISVSAGLGASDVASAVWGAASAQALTDRISSIAVNVASNAVAISSISVSAGLGAADVASAVWGAASAQALTSRLSSMDTRVGSAAVQVGSNATAIGSLHTRVASAQAGIDAIGTVASSALVAIGSAQVGVDSANVAIGSLHTRVGSAATQIGSNAVAIGSANTALGSLHTRVGSAATGIGSLTGITRNSRMLSDITAISSDANAADIARRGHLATVVGNTTGDSTVSVISAANLSPSPVVADQWLGRTLIFDRETLTAALRGQPAAINSMSAGGLLYISSLTTAPPSGNAFTIT